MIAEEHGVSFEDGENDLKLSNSDRRTTLNIRKITEL